MSLSASSPVFLAPAWNRWFEATLRGADARNGDDYAGVPAEREISSERGKRDVRLAIDTDESIRDAALSVRLRESDVDAFTTVFRAYYTALVAFLRQYTTSLSDAEDIAQESMIVLWERRQTLDAARSLRALLFTVARHRAVDAQRHRRHTVTHATQVQAQHAMGAAPMDSAADAQMLADELDHVAARHVATLSPRQQEIFQLSRGEGLSPAEIAAILGIATQTVYVQLGRISKSLYDALAAWTKER